MNQLSQRDMELHVNILAWIFIVSQAVFLLIGAFVFVLLIGIGVVSGDSEAMTVLGIIAAAVGGLLTLLAIPGLVAGFGLLRRKNWARVLAIVVAIIGLLNFPIGTAIGIYALWVLLQDAAGGYFSSASVM